MSQQTEKYAGLPDIDSAPDVYQTPETVTTDRPVSPTSSSASSYRDLSEDDAESGVIRPHNNPKAAQRRFKSARIKDARKVDYSDQVSRKKRSYQTDGRLDEDGADPILLEGTGFRVDEGVVNGERVETVHEKVARLKREIEEVAEESKGDGSGLGSVGAGDGEEGVLGDVAELSSMLQGVESRLRSGETRSRRNAKPSEEPDVSVSKIDAMLNDKQVRQLPPDSRSLMQNAAALESRLSILESALGLNEEQRSLSGGRAADQSRNVLSTIGALEQQFRFLSDSSIPQIEAMDKQIRQLTQSARELESARKEAEARPDAEVNGVGQGADSETAQESEQHAKGRKIDAIYQKLPQIEARGQLLPLVIERLRALRILHSNAADAGNSLESLEKQQIQINEEIKSWQSGLNKVNTLIQQGEQSSATNREEIEKWVHDIEKRIDGLS